MNFFDRLRPKWKNSDPAIRRQGVLALDDQEVLERIVDSDPSEEVRLAAVERLTDQPTLARLARGTSSLAIPAMKRLSDRTLIHTVAQSAELREVREMAVDRIEDRGT